ncbi:MAG: T9SS type A sorting domain-containing protein [Lewinellaceae bacterium]|nr:T9SS type A sorting domain-containing protein [Lewinellaceae bacterium]MCB9288480.1 T9SS type A sorting domain-containing protein [Lewinellaceae bacterium]
MKSIVCITGLLLAFALSLPAQPYQPMDIPFRVNGKNLALSLAGGLNNPQFNEIDLNNDQINDLYIFDRTGDVQLTFINEGTPGEASYRFAPQYAAYFPAELNDWVLLRDFNQDGAMDLFTQAQGRAPFQGIIVFYGYYQNGHIAFQRMLFDNEYSLVNFTLLNGTETQVYVSNVDYPAIDDLDCDGDLDILTFNPAGGYIEMYANQSVEDGYGLDSLIFELVEDCWGGIFESSIEQAVGLAESPGDCFNLAGEQAEVTMRHPGSTLLTFDSDDDGDKDLVLGDITFSTLNFLLNGGTCQQAWVVDQDNGYPSYDVTANIPIFPAAFFLDLNNDGKKDLIASPNAINLSENYNVAWFYENTNTTEEPVFEFRQQDLLVGEMVDLGSGAYPAFVDYNADGLQDLVVGNIGYWMPGGQRDARLFLYENTGTADDPAFELVNANFLNLNVFNDNYSFAPAFGDLDNDGDMDILVGEIYGQLFYAENTAGPGNPVAYGPWQYGYMGINIGQLSIPFIVDLNRDGLKDLIVGERTGNINYFQNIGAASAPMFNPNPDESPNLAGLGNIRTSVPGSITGYSAPIVLDQEGQYILITGTEVGQIEFYNDIEGNITGAFHQETETLGDIKVGRRTRPAMADIDNDGFLEIIIGNERGGLSGFQTPISLNSTSPAREAVREEIVKVFPNPAGEWVTLQAGAEGKKSLSLFNSSGQLVAERQWNGERTTVNTGGLPAGLYFARVIVNGKAIGKKILVR